MKLVELSDDCTVDLRRIVAVEAMIGKTRVLFAGRRSIIVDSPYNKVMKIIHEASKRAVEERL